MAQWYLQLIAMCVCLVHGASGAVKREAGFDMQPVLHNVVFSQGVLVEGSVRSQMDCGQLCASVSCATFTFTRQGPVSGFCRCHSTIMTSSSDNTPTVDSTTFTSSSDTTEMTTVDLEGPCYMHTQLYDDWRSTSATVGTGKSERCDNNLNEGWYRFYLYGSNAVMPTECVEEHYCKTHITQWLDLQGQPLPEAGQEVNARTCSNYVGDCCWLASPATVRNCGSFFVYKLKPIVTCSAAHCVEPQS